MKKILKSVILFEISGVECGNCVIQWRYIAGNNWGMCSDGTGAVGCGPQEEFRACSDISIGNIRYYHFHSLKIFHHMNNVASNLLFVSTLTPMNGQVMKLSQRKIPK